MGELRAYRLSPAFKKRRVMRNRHICNENHTGPPANINLSPIAGWRAFGKFCDEGGYGTDQSVLDAIEALNEDYQEDEYVPRQTEAQAILDWLDTTREEDEAGVWAADRDAKAERFNEIGAEIDAIWCALADTIRDMVSDESYDEFISA
jgi:hypothetical protein